jgi:hypothetical protein
MIGKRKTTAKQTWWLATLLLAPFIWAAESGNNEGANEVPENRATAAIRIMDEYGRQAASGKRYVGSETFDVTVGPVGNEFRFVPDNRQHQRGRHRALDMGQRFSQCHVMHCRWAILFAC